MKYNYEVTNDKLLVVIKDCINLKTLNTELGWGRLGAFLGPVMIPTILTKDIVKKLITTDYCKFIYALNPLNMDELVLLNEDNVYVDLFNQTSDQIVEVKHTPVIEEVLAEEKKIEEVIEPVEEEKIEDAVIAPVEEEQSEEVVEPVDDVTVEEEKIEDAVTAPVEEKIEQSSFTKNGRKNR